MNTDLELMCNAQVSAIIRTVLERCQKENEQQMLQNPIENIVERTSFYTGFPRATINKILDVHKQSKTYLLAKFDVSERILITSVLQKYYSEGKYPKYYDTYILLKDQLPSQGFYHFKNEMTNLGFCYTPTKLGWLLVEDPEQRFDRYNYLNKIIKFKNEKRKIVYVDVWLIGASDQELDSCAEKKLPIDQSILLLAMSEQGIENFLFSNVISSELYKKWVFDVLLPTLPTGTVLVMNDNFMLGNLLNNNLTRYNSKTEMLIWLNANNIPCSETMHKSELYELYAKSAKRSKEYVIDKLLQANGYHVLHLPHRCNELSMTTILWGELNTSGLLCNGGSSPLAIRSLLVRDLENLCNQRAVECQKQITVWENKMFSIDLQIEQHLDDRYTFDVPHQKSF